MAKKEKYRLEALLKIAERKKRQCEIRLAKAIRELEEEKKKLTELEKLKEALVEKKNKTRQDVHQKMMTGQSFIKQSHLHMGYLEKIKDDIDAMDKDIEEQKENIKEVQNKLKRARRDYVDAANEHNTMTKHKELWTKKQNQALSAAENKKMNEIANNVFQLNKFRGGGL